MLVLYVFVYCIIDCGDPTPEHGFAQLPSGTTYGSSAWLQCIDTYSLVGDSLIECLDGGLWSDLPPCLKGMYIYNISTTNSMR